MIVHLAVVKAIDPGSLEVDLRTRQGREAEVIEQVYTYGGFTVFWGTELQKRAHAIDRLVERGAIKRVDDKRVFPWCSYELSEEIKEELEERYK